MEWEKMSDGGSAPLPIHSRRRPTSTPTITGNDGFPCISQGHVKSGSCRGSMGKRRCPHPINRHASTKVAGYWGPRRSALDFGFAEKPSTNTPWAQGLLSAYWGRGSPDLRACRPWRGSTRGPVRPVFTNKHPRPSRGDKPREADDTRPPREWPHQAGSRGAERSRQDKPREVLVT